jgi:hypothetical protein
MGEPALDVLQWGSRAFAAKVRLGFGRTQSLLGYVHQKRECVRRIGKEKPPFEVIDH